MDLLDDQVPPPRGTGLDGDQPTVHVDRARGIRASVRVGSTVAVVALAAFAIVVAPNLLRSTAGPAGPVPNGSPTPTARATGPVPSTTLPVPEQLNPAVQYGAFGWLPAGLTDQWLTSTAASYELSVYYPGSDAAVATPVVTLVLHPAVGPPAGPSPIPGPVEPSSSPPPPSEPSLNPPSLSPLPPPFSGLPSTGSGRVRIVALTATVTPPQTSVTLQWYYAPRALAELTVAGLRPGGGTAREVAQRVAANLQYSVDALVPLPLRPTKIPRTLPLRSLLLQRFAQGNPHPWQLRMEFSDTTGETDGQMFRALVVEALASTARTGDGRKIPDPTTTFAGHPAYYETSQYGQMLFVYDVEGMYVKVWNSDPAITEQLPAGGVKTVYLDLDLHPDHWS
jgi:hypothetical protein